MALFKSVQSGDWYLGTTWDQGSVPGSTDDVEIRNGHTVTVTANTTRDNGTKTTVNLGGILDLNGGSLTIGSGADAFIYGTLSSYLRNLVINGTVTWYGTYVSTNYSQIIVNSGGVLTVFGALNLQDTQFSLQLGGLLQVIGGGIIDATGGAGEFGVNGTLEIKGGGKLVISNSYPMALYGTGRVVFDRREGRVENMNGSVVVGLEKVYGYYVSAGVKDG